MEIKYICPLGILWCLVLETSAAKISECRDLISLVMCQITEHQQQQQQQHLFPENLSDDEMFQIPVRYISRLHLAAFRMWGPFTTWKVIGQTPVRHIQIGLIGLLHSRWSQLVTAQCLSLVWGAALQACHQLRCAAVFNWLSEPVRSREKPLGLLFAHLLMKKSSLIVVKLPTLRHRHCSHHCLRASSRFSVLLQLNPSSSYRLFFFKEHNSDWSFSSCENIYVKLQQFSCLDRSVHMITGISGTFDSLAKDGSIDILFTVILCVFGEIVSSKKDSS